METEEHPPRGGFHLFHLTICCGFFSFFLMSVTQTLPLALTPEVYPAGIPAFLYAEAGALLIPSSCIEESPNGQKPPKTF